MSPEVSRFFGFEPNELIGQSLGEIIPDSPGLIQALDLIVPQKTPEKSHSLTGLSKDGKEILLELSVNKFRCDHEFVTIVVIHQAEIESQLLIKSSLPIIYLILDKMSNIVLMNTAGCNLVGSSEETLIGLNWFENFLPAPNFDHMQALFEQGYREGSIDNFETPVLTLRGEQHTVRWSTFIVYNITGKPIYTLSIGVDTGQQVNRELDRDHISRIDKLNKQLESRVKRQNQELVDTLANLENINRDLELQIRKRKEIEQKFMKIQRLYDTVVHNFPNGVIAVLNRKMKYVLIDGKDLGEIDMPALGLTDYKIATPEDSILARETIRKIKKAFDGETISFEVKTKDRFYSITAVPLLDTHNKINEVLCVLQNVTRQKEMEDGLVKALEQERALGDLKSRFVTMACHEFKTPLATILSSNFLLENYTEKDYEKEKMIHTGRIKRAVNNLTMILNEFLLSEKLEENQVEVVNVEINIPKYIRELVTEAETLKQKDQIIEYHHLGPQQLVYLAPHILWSILTNLISNSLKYSGKGDTIHLTTEIKNNSLTIILRDHGIGIPPEEINFIFERFYRTRNALNIKGTGLGLHIVEKNIKLFNGSISASSQLNVGTEFTVVLPNGVRKKAPEPTLFDNQVI